MLKLYLTVESIKSVKHKPRTRPSLRPHALNKRWRIPRPLNPFIIYRRETHPEVVRSHEGIANHDVSKIIGQMWADEPTYVKRIYQDRSDEGKFLHEVKHPGYRFTPRKQKPKRSKKSTDDIYDLKSRSSDAFTL
ncbi:hypothetical protein PhCBS80983_g05924 [Powellomyces hirtus]|uniref:HMG box domain-containing protein n=1 Tax=Powellomyces hirtus TaxID=109895 RepID=A0A507DRU7_9FUNG|nr:hypothetical protein PhCBS80983_g05924 [Powellomyces hirtus]